MKSDDPTVHSIFVRVLLLRRKTRVSNRYISQVINTWSKNNWEMIRWNASLTSHMYWVNVDWKFREFIFPISFIVLMISFLYFIWVRLVFLSAMTSVKKARKWIYEEIDFEMTINRTLLYSCWINFLDTSSTRKSRCWITDSMTFVLLSIFLFFISTQRDDSSSCTSQLWQRRQ